jgi:hypothetical protein
MNRLVRVLAVGLCAAVLFTNSALAHDSITPEARKSYVAKLQELQSQTSATTPTAVRAKSLYEMGLTLDEIRELFNQDIASHGSVRGFETSMLFNELVRAGYKLETSKNTGLYFSQLQYYREAIRLESRAPIMEHARYMLLESHFYDSFFDNPLAPISQTKETLSEMIAIGESLMKSRHPQVKQEEVRFILGIHYLQAIKQQQIDREQGLKKVKKLAQELRKDYPQSLKLVTLEALMP